MKRGKAGPDGPAFLPKKHLKMQAESVIIILQRVAGMRKSSWAYPPLSLFSRREPLIKSSAAG